MATKRFKVQKIVSVQTAHCLKGFKRFQTMNKGLIKRNYSFNVFISDISLIIKSLKLNNNKNKSLNYDNIFLTG